MITKLPVSFSNSSSLFHQEVSSEGFAFDTLSFTGKSSTILSDTLLLIKNNFTIPAYKKSMSAFSFYNKF